MTLCPGPPLADGLTGPVMRYIQPRQTPHPYAQIEEDTHNFSSFSCKCVAACQKFAFKGVTL